MSTQTILLIIIVILLSIIALMMSQIISIKNQIETIRKEKKTNRLVRLNLFGLKINALVIEINNLIKAHIKKEQDVEYEKVRLKQQVASISHDLRTPLTSIVGYLDIIKRCEISEEAKKYIDIIEKKSEVMQKLVEDFYEVSIIEDKSYEYVLDKLMPGYLMEDMVMSCYDELESEGIDVKFEMIEDKEVLGNASALSRVYANLLSNIKKHGCEYAIIHHSIIDGKLTTTITNKIKPQATLEEARLFEKFYTGEKSRHQTSSGIGMYSSKIMLEKMNHQISAKLEDNNMIITIVYN